MSDILKYCLTRGEEWVSPSMIHNLDATINYLEVGRWMRQWPRLNAPSQTAGTVV